MEQPDRKNRMTSVMRVLGIREVHMRNLEITKGEVIQRTIQTLPKTTYCKK